MLIGRVMLPARNIFGNHLWPTQETREFDPAEAVRWGLRAQYGRGGTTVMAKLQDGTQVEVARSKQTKPGQKYLEAVVKRIGYVQRTGAISEKWEG
jgi:hypothetical protein